MDSRNENDEEDFDFEKWKVWLSQQTDLIPLEARYHDPGLELPKQFTIPMSQKEKEFIKQH